MKHTVPVLMYHAILHEEDDTSGYIHISLNAFERQMQWLAQQGYQTVTVSELGQGVSASAKCVAITFDDGYYSLYQLVTPVLRRYGFTATLFLTTFPVGASGYDVLPQLEKSYPVGDRPLTWQELTEMEQSCWDIQAHGHRHLVHNALPEEELHREIEESKSLIEQHLHKVVTYYAFPYGRYNNLCLQLCKQLGFGAVFTVQPGLAPDANQLFALPRVEINRWVNDEVFATKMRTGYSNRKQQWKWAFGKILYRNIRLKDVLKRMYDKVKK
ncbi:Peptidoglycan/xylan/chitin deacetylase, PgdA/CDA1 family [Filimonas lacunae]|uniref:Peptidoglycan/xylan/chitin deacetylase, PgdA/CDA1 family n=1 Tax=Filimonas lacunae TaxID=477680 RepID=A0A173MLL9_9BACT|nr:polysaccharide deacetylase family protein [Filimonas lacunae]BAV08359.1 polysaccharide deacetylase [Filimonas lacunae]SIT33455.1 Peptidoglycan/xylan/chitin deacetylase, PgdA/CDA1 family [Filimonas lacunae]